MYSSHPPTAIAQFHAEVDADLITFVMALLSFCAAVLVTSALSRAGALRGAAVMAVVGCLALCAAAATYRAGIGQRATNDVQQYRDNAKQAAQQFLQRYQPAKVRSRFAWLATLWVSLALAAALLWYWLDDPATRGACLVVAALSAATLLLDWRAFARDLRYFSYWAAQP